MFTTCELHFPPNSHWDHGKNQCWQVTAFLSTRLGRLFKNNSGFIFPFVSNVFPITPYFRPICFAKCCLPLSCILEPNEKAHHGPNVFFGFAGSEGEGGIFHFPLVPNAFLVSSQ